MRIRKKAAAINQKEVCRILEKAGWHPTGHGKGSHRVYENPETGQMTTIPHGEITKGTLAAIRRQTGIDQIR